MEIFISHSSRDQAYVEALVELLQHALLLPPGSMTASSVDGMHLRAGAVIDDQIRETVRDAKVFLAVISANSLKSNYVLFEIGARWGASLAVIPILVPDITAKDVSRGPLSTLNIVESDQTGLWNMLDTVAAHLGTTIDPTVRSSPSLQRDLDAVIRSHQGVFTDMAYAVLSYVVDAGCSFALLRDDFYGTLQPPGRKVLEGERPNEVALDVVRQELDLSPHQVRFHPPFLERTYGGVVNSEEAATKVVVPPYQVQVEKKQHRTSSEHYDLVYVFLIDEHTPILSAQRAPLHKTDPNWYQVDQLRTMCERGEATTHPDMLPTMETILSDLGA
jgi:hypothetical protein